MIITVDSLLSRPKLDCDEGYDVAVKGPSVVVLTYSKLCRSELLEEGDEDSES